MHVCQDIYVYTTSRRVQKDEDFTEAMMGNLCNRSVFSFGLFSILYLSLVFSYFFRISFSLFVPDACCFFLHRRCSCYTLECGIQFYTRARGSLIANSMARRKCASRISALSGIRCERSIGNNLCK